MVGRSGRRARTRARDPYSIPFAPTPRCVSLSLFCVSLSLSSIAFVSFLFYCNCVLTVFVLGRRGGGGGRRSSPPRSRDGGGSLTRRTPLQTPPTRCHRCRGVCSLSLFCPCVSFFDCVCSFLFCFVLSVVSVSVAAVAACQLWLLPAVEPPATVDEMVVPPPPPP